MIKFSFLHLQFACLCNVGYYGIFCEHYDSCTIPRCASGGNCMTLSNTTWECNCQDGYYGDLCEVYNLCDSEPCLNFATCVNTTFQVPGSLDTRTGYECNCLDRFYGDRCESYDPCSTEPCLNMATCSSLTNETYYCECTHDSIGGNNCQTYDFCSEIDLCVNDGECLLTNAQPDVLDWSTLRTVSVQLDGAAATLQVRIS